MSRGDREEVFERLAAVTAEFSVVPFVGAGCSAGLVGGYDWKSVTQDMADELGLRAWDDETVVAEVYEERFGRRKLEGFLRDRLMLTTFDDEKGTAHLAVMSTLFPAIYTTNVENAVELCHQKYGRPLSVVSALDDLRSVVPGRPILYKYHGSLDREGTVIWTKTDYASRFADHNFFLNVRLRSDLLTKTLLFLGYSVRDPHVVDLIANMQRLYADGVRRSILVARGDAGSFRTRLQSAGLDVEVLSPMELYPDATDEDDAFARFLSELLERIVRLRAACELENLLTPRAPEPRPVLSAFELAALERSLPTLSLQESVDAFRLACDAHMIPLDLEERVSRLARQLMKRAHDEPNAPDFSGLLLNLTLSVPHMISVLSHAHTLYAVRGNDRMFVIPVQGIPDTKVTRLVLIAAAIGLLTGWRKPLNNFGNWFAYQQFDKTDLEAVPDGMRDFVGRAIEELYKEAPSSNPLLREYPGNRLATKTFQELTSDMFNSLPIVKRPPFGS